MRPRRPIRRLTVTPSANCSGSLVRYLFRDGSLSDLSHGIWATLQSGPGELWVATTQAHELNVSFREAAKEVRSQRLARINHLHNLALTYAEFICLPKRLGFQSS
jgi:hypothetical protein